MCSKTLSQLSTSSLRGEAEPLLLQVTIPTVTAFGSEAQASLCAMKEGMCKDTAVQEPRPDLGLHSATGGNTSVGVVLK